ncbi:hypothetical protein H4218_004374 [Coemansia sp. IMI 209128]|nr:hypothetical protein H4218_004374 [Coemansia sp. IMI 209128]
MAAACASAIGRHLVRSGSPWRVLLTQSPINAVTCGALGHRQLHSSMLVLAKQVRPTEPPSPLAKAVPEAPSQPDANATIKLPMYDFPLTKPIVYLRRVFVANAIFTTSFSIWVGREDIYAVLAAGVLLIGGFIPVALAQLTYRDHVRNVRILGGLSQKVLARAKQAARAGKSQVEYPLTNDTPLLIKRFSLNTSDPEDPLYVRDLVPGPSRRFSVMWLYRSASGMEKFRLSKKVIKHHPDMRALDERIRQNAKDQALVQAREAQKKEKEA